MATEKYGKTEPIWRTEVDCTTVRQLLNEYIEDNLTDSVSESLSRHLQECKRCEAEEHLVRTLTATLHSLPRRPVPPGFTDEVMGRLTHLGEMPTTESAEDAGILSTLASASGLQPTWVGVRMISRSVRFAKYIPRPTVRLRIGDDRSQSLTKLPLALGFRW